MTTVAYMTSYHQNVHQPYLIDCRTLQHIMSHPALQSAISRYFIVELHVAYVVFDVSEK